VKTAAARRRATFTRGHVAECVALLVLMAKGYRPLARRYAAAGGEIDLIVRRGGTVAFVEVKARGLMADALTSAATKTWRADAVFVAPRRWPRHLEAAFEIEMP
jgi:putative endonuclease